MKGIGLSEPGGRRILSAARGLRSHAGCTGRHTMKSIRCDRASGAACASVVSALCGAAAGQPVFQGLGFLPGGTASEAAGVSADGTVVVGTNLAPQVRAFRWTAGG